ncbi:MAG: response regulator [Cyanothece sp. SIO1E1]|nr:response regulator [Cyanothece sp. SIO1E1]
MISRPVMPIQPDKNQGLIDQLTTQQQTKFTGQLEIRAPEGRQWNLYFCVGHLVWVTTEKHIVRRLYRHASQECQKISLPMLTVREQDGFEYGWDYHVIKILILRKILTKEQAQVIITHIITEVLFDILQYEIKGFTTYKSLPNAKLETGTDMLTLLKTDQILIQLKAMWQVWQKAGLQHLSPNLAPVLDQLKELEQQTSPRVYQTLKKLVDGQHTFRDLASSTKQQQKQVVLSLIPFIKKGLIKLVDCPDLPRPEPKVQAERTQVLRRKTDQATIACVDDSDQICFQMQRIIDQFGCQFIGIQDPIRALTTLVDKKPDLVFLDLVMPVANGYEICSQLRRISALQQTPIIILTGGIIDRIRAKMVGASDCMTKPVDEQKVREMIQKHLY